MEAVQFSPRTKDHQTLWSYMIMKMAQSPLVVKIRLPLVRCFNKWTSIWIHILRIWSVCLFGSSGHFSRSSLTKISDQTKTDRSRSDSCGKFQNNIHSWKSSCCMNRWPAQGMRTNLIWQMKPHSSLLLFFCYKIWFLFIFLIFRSSSKSFFVSLKITFIEYWWKICMFCIV